MMEISLALEQGSKYYYMGTCFSALLGSVVIAAGYYIHTCPKMRYKRDFKPTFVLGQIYPRHAWRLD